MLEPEEIKKLVEGINKFEADKSTLEDNEKKLLSNIFESSLLKSLKTLDKITSVSSEISNINVEVINGKLLSETFDLKTNFLEDILFNSNFATVVIENDIVKKISTLVTEEVDDSETLSDKEVATIKEVVEQFVDSFTKNLSKDLKLDVKCEFNADSESELITKENMLQLSFSLKIGDKVDSTVYAMVSYEAVNEIIDKLFGGAPEGNSSEVEEEEGVATVQPIKFEEFSDAIPANEKENIDLLMDLQLQVSVELGKVKKPIKEILQFTQGTIVELDRLAGENVDILISGKIIAKGEVVVVDQNFGVRITQIVIPEKRV